MDGELGRLCYSAPFFIRGVERKSWDKLSKIDCFVF